MRDTFAYFISNFTRRLPILAALILFAPTVQAADQSDAVLICQALPVETADLSFQPALPPKAPPVLRQSSWDAELALVPVRPETVAAAKPSGPADLCDVG